MKASRASSTGATQQNTLLQWTKTGQENLNGLNLRNGNAAELCRDLERAAG